MAGLNRVAESVPVGRTFLEGMVGATSTSGLFVRGQVGHRFTQAVSGFGFVEANRRETMGGAGIQIRF